MARHLGLNGTVSYPLNKGAKPDQEQFRQVVLHACSVNAELPAFSHRVLLDVDRE